MRKSRFTDSHIFTFLKQKDKAQRFRTFAVSVDSVQLSFIQWRSKFGSMDASLMKRMKELEDENRRLKNVRRRETEVGFAGGTTSKKWRSHLRKKEIAKWLCKVSGHLKVSRIVLDYQRLASVQRGLVVNRTGQA